MCIIQKLISELNSKLKIDILQAELYFSLKHRKNGLRRSLYNIPRGEAQALAVSGLYHLVSTPICMFVGFFFSFFLYIYFLMLTKLSIK